MRRSSIYQGRSRSLELKMTPMIDVVFLLLVFFVWTASFRIVEQTLPSQLTAVRGRQPEDPVQLLPEQDFPEMVILISWTGQSPAWQINGVKVNSLEELSDRLRQVANIKPDAPVTVDPQPDVPLGAVIDVYDVCRLAGFQKVGLVATDHT